MPFASRFRFSWRLRSRTLPLGRRTLLMGILNVTPDSFSDGNSFLDPQVAHDHALFLLDEGADLLDIGGESTRPNAAPVSPGDEIGRVIPVIRSVLKARPDTILSVDTYHAETARAALDAGAEIINDVSGLLWDREMADVLAKEHPGVVMMHTRGAPRLWSMLPPLPHAEILPMVVTGLAHSLQLARSAGIAEDRIVLDPGFGFGKMGDENFTLLAHMAQLQQFEMPLLAGISRKRFLTAWLKQIPHDHDLIRRNATSAANTVAILNGAHLLRVHDIPAARGAAHVADSILQSCRDYEPIGRPT